MKQGARAAVTRAGYRGADRRTTGTPAFPARRAAAPAAFLAAAGAVAAAVLPSATVRLSIPESSTAALTGGATVVVFAAAGMLAWIRFRLAGDALSGAVGLVLLLQGTVALPLATVAPLLIAPTIALPGVQLVTGGAVLAVCASAARAPQVDSGYAFARRYLVLSSGSILTAGALGRWPALTDVLGHPLLGLPAVDLMLALVATLVAARLAAAGWRRDRGVLVATAAAVLALGGGRVLRAVGLTGLPGFPLGAAALHLTAAAVVLLAVVADLRLVLSTRTAREQTVRARWTTAEERARAAEAEARRRSHDLRNGLAGIAGATHVLGVSPRLDDPELAALATAVHDEVVRLQRAVAPAPRASGRVHESGQQKESA